MCNISLVFYNVYFENIISLKFSLSIYFAHSSNAPKIIYICILHNCTSVSYSPFLFLVAEVAIHLIEA